MRGKRVLAVLLCVTMLSMAACGIGPIKEKVSFEGSAAAESELYVAPVEGMTDEFIRGIDISSYVSEKDAGVSFYDFDGNELDDQEFFDFLADCGVNWVRVRVWNNPYNKDGMGYGGGNNDIEKAVTIGRLATKAGMNVLIDFHYSDFWADPNKQMAPKEWDDKSVEDKVTLISEFTTECLNELLDEDVNVKMVQIGNEINAGMAGESSSTNVYTLLKAASAAVREVSKDIKIAVHYTNPENGTFTGFADKLAATELDYDVFGISYYPYWHGTLENLKEVMKTIKTKHGVETVVMETSYAYTMEDGDGFSNSIGEGATGVEYRYEISLQGQANALRDVMAVACEAGGLGVFYWEPAWIPVDVWVEGAQNANAVYESNKQAWEKYGCGWAASYSAKYDAEDAGKWYGGSSWDNQALFAFDGKPLESLNVFKYVFGGTTAQNKICYVDDIEHQAGVGKTVEMPTTVEATMLDGSKVEVPVVWNTSQITDAESKGAGNYSIEGTVSADGVEYGITCELSILKVNYIQNAGFEDDDMSMWSVIGEGIDRTKDNNKRTGDYSLKFWSEQDVVYSAEQTILNLSAGVYDLSAFLQGGDAGADAIFELYIKVNGTEYKAAAKVDRWLNWDNPTIKGVEIPEGAEVVVGVRADAAAKAWGAWDDFTLYEAGAGE